MDFEKRRQLNIGARPKDFHKNRRSDWLKITIGPLFIIRIMRDIEWPHNTYRNDPQDIKYCYNSTLYQQLDKENPSKVNEIQYLAWNITEFFKSNRHTRQP